MKLQQCICEHILQLYILLSCAFMLITAILGQFYWLSSSVTVNGQNFVARNALNIQKIKNTEILGVILGPYFHRQIACKNDSDYKMSFVLNKTSIAVYSNLNHLDGKIFKDLHTEIQTNTAHTSNRRKHFPKCGFNEQ